MPDHMERGIVRRIGPGSPLAEKYGDFLDRMNAEFRARRRFYDDGVIADTRWNGWRLNPSNFTLQLVIEDDWVTYEIDLEQCDQSAQILDWIVQISGKDWGSKCDIDKITIGLLYAFDDVLYLQANLCGFGAHQTLTRQQIRDKVTCFVQQFHEGEQP